MPCTDVCVCVCVCVCDEVVGKNLGLVARFVFASFALFPNNGSLIYLLSSYNYHFLHPLDAQDLTRLISSTS